MPIVLLCVHAEENTRMVVTWVTFDPTSTSEVRYGLSGQGLTHNATGTATVFVDKSWTSETIRYVHRVNMTGLLPLSKYGMYMYVQLYVRQLNLSRDNLVVYRFDKTVKTCIFRAYSKILGGSKSRNGIMEYV